MGKHMNKRQRNMSARTLLQGEMDEHECLHIFSETMSFPKVANLAFRGQCFFLGWWCLYLDRNLDVFFSKRDSFLIPI